MSTVATNPDLSLSWRIPGTYVYLNLNAPGAGAGAIRKRILLLGERESTGALAGNAIYRATDESTVNTNSGTRSTVAREFRAVISQIGPGIADIYVGHVDAASGGTAATFPLVCSGTATIPGQAVVYMAGYVASVGFGVGDVAADVLADLKVELDKLTKIPGTWSAITDASPAAGQSIMTFIYTHVGVIGNDCPIRVYVTPSSGIHLGPGRIVYSGIAAGAGTATVTCGTRSVSSAISNTDAAAVTAAAINTAINASVSIPLEAGYVAASVNVDLYYKNGRDARRASAAIVTSTVQQVAINGGGAGATAQAGVSGAGAVTLTTLLTNVNSWEGFKRWVCPWTDTATLSALATQIETDGGGLRQKGQTLHYCTVGTESAAAAIPTGTSPTLSSSTRYAGVWYIDAPQQGYEYAARTAAIRIVDNPVKNYDGMPLKTDSQTPLLQPDSAQWATESDVSTAINDNLTPLAYNQEAGTTSIVFGRTTSASADRSLQDWSTIDQLDWQREEIVSDFTTTFADAVYKVSSPAFTPDVITPESIADRMYTLTTVWDRQDRFDGAEALKDGIQATPNVNDPGRIDLVYTASVVAILHQIGVVANRGSAPV